MTAYKTQKRVYHIVKEYVGVFDNSEIVATETSRENAVSKIKEFGGSDIQTDYHGQYQLQIDREWVDCDNVERLNTDLRKALEELVFKLEDIRGIDFDVYAPLELTNARKVLNETENEN